MCASTSSTIYKFKYLLMHTQSFWRHRFMSQVLARCYSSAEALCAIMLSLGHSVFSIDPVNYVLNELAPW